MYVPDHVVNSWRPGGNHWVHVSRVPGGEFIGLTEVVGGLWHVYFDTHLLGYLHDDLGTVENRAGFISRRNRKLSAMSPD
jgi:hypothetical protein